jgi:hypothetical protein
LASNRERSALALAAMFRTPNADVARACLAILQRVSAGVMLRLSWHDLGLLLEELTLGSPDDEVWEALQASGLFRLEGEILVAADWVHLSQLYQELSPEDDDPVSAAQIGELLVEPRVSSDPTPATPRGLQGAIARVSTWGLDLIRAADVLDLPGFPVFWERRERSNAPFGLDVGSSAISDTLLLWLDCARFGLPPAFPGYVGSSAVARAWEQLIELGADDPESWYDGAAQLRGFDDDYVGSFLREKATLGACPTLEATAERLFTLSLLAHEAGSLAWLDRAGNRGPGNSGGPKNTDEWALGVRLRSSLIEATTSEIESAARCVIRWQSDSGGWAVHRYEAAAYLMPDRDVSCYYAATALMLGLRLGSLNTETSTAATKSLRRFADLLRRESQRADGLVWWRGDFVGNDPGERLRATCLFAWLLGGLAEHLEDSRLSDLQAGAVSYLAAHWDPAQQVFVVLFRAPTWDGPALSTFTWEMPSDPLMVSAILDYSARGGKLDEELSAKVQLALTRILAAESDGSWLDVPMLKQGMRKAFPSNSLHNLRALLAAAAWQARALPKTLHAGLL